MTTQNSSIDHEHARYVIVVWDFGVCLYSEDAEGQWNATGLNEPQHATVEDAAAFQRALPNGQTSIEIVNRISPAMVLGGSPNQDGPRWYATNADAIPAFLRHVDAHSYSIKKANFEATKEVESDVMSARTVSISGLSHTTREVKDALKNNCLNVYVRSTNGNVVRVMDARRKGEVFQVRSINSGVWFDVEPSDNIYQA